MDMHPQDAAAVLEAVEHTGELSGDLVTYIAGGAAMASRIVLPLFGVATEKTRRLVAIGMSTVLLWAWAIGMYEWSREGVFALLMGYVAIVAATIAMFDLSNQSTISAVTHTATGGRIGVPAKE